MITYSFTYLHTLSYILHTLTYILTYFHTLIYILALHTLHSQMEIVCKKCGYIWRYTGDKKRISCSKCKTSITIHQEQQKHKAKADSTHKYKIEEGISKEAVDHALAVDRARKRVERKQQLNEMTKQKQKPEDPLVVIKFPLSLWKDVRFKQRIDHAPSLGENHIVLKVDKDGVLSL